MTENALGNDLDSGTLRALSEQAVDEVEGAEAIAIWNERGDAIWFSPANLTPRQKKALKLSKRQRPTHPDAPGIRGFKRDHLIYDFALCPSDGGDVRGVLSLLVKKSPSTELAQVRPALRPILDCLVRQIDINAELSSVRRLSETDHNGLNLMYELSQCDASQPPAENAERILAASISHFGCDRGAILLPAQRLEVLVPAPSDATNRKRFISVAGKVFANVTTQQRVVVANVERVGKPPQIMLGCPILDARDRVIGLFALTRDETFSREHVSLARAAAAKLSILLRADAKPARDGMSRHDLIDYVDGYSKRHASTSHSLFYMDLDRLHVVNDSFGHAAGDDAIARALKVLQEVTGQGDLVAHLTGDRFAIFCSDCDQKRAREHAEAMLAALRRDSLTFDGKTIEMTASMGVAVMPLVTSDASEALSIAEVASRGAKERGGNRAVVFQDMDASMMQRRSDLDQVGYIQTALLGNRFVIYAQTIAPLSATSAGQRFELLVRMLDDDGEIVPPGRFMSAAERYQIMPALDRWVINRSLDQISAANNPLEINLATFSINVSAQSLADESFLPYVESRIHESGISPDALCFEITETAAVRNLERANHFINKLQRIGCRFALDDFGTGYSSFAYLKHLPMQYIKIDGVFVRDVIENKISQAIVEAATGIGRVIGAATVAEHVENDLVAQKLRSLGVDFIQGFGVAKPIPLSEVLAELDSTDALAGDGKEFVSTMTLRLQREG